MWPRWLDLLLRDPYLQQTNATMVGKPLPTWRNTAGNCLKNDSISKSSRWNLILRIGFKTDTFRALECYKAQEEAHPRSNTWHALVVFAANLKACHLWQHVSGSLSYCSFCERDLILIVVLYRSNRKLYLVLPYSTSIYTWLWVSCP